MTSEASYRVSAVTLYCASSQSVDPVYLEVARDFGERLARSGRTLVYGAGAIGLMGAASRGARDAGGRVVGVITRRLKDAEQMDRGNSENIVVRTMRERKTLLEAWGDALVVLPGGLGTLEEFFEVYTGRLLGEHDKPVILVSPPDVRRPEAPRGFFSPMLAMLDHMIEGGFAKPGVLDLLTVVASPEEAIAELDGLENAGGPAAVDSDALLPTTPGA
jgi:uncharacterized protein (TIGR00730 family)